MSASVESAVAMLSPLAQEALLTSRANIARVRALAAAGVIVFTEDDSLELFKLVLSLPTIISGADSDGAIRLAARVDAFAKRVAPGGEVVS